LKGFETPTDDRHPIQRKDLTLSVSLKGLAAALDRLQALAGT
jgi:invasion protein IalB